MAQTLYVYQGDLGGTPNLYKSAKEGPHISTMVDRVDPTWLKISIQGAPNCAQVDPKVTQRAQSALVS